MDEKKLSWWTKIFVIGIIFSLSLLTIVTLIVEPGNTEVTLRFAHWAQPKRAWVVKLPGSMFEEEHPNIKIKYEYIPYTKYIEKSLTMLAAGTAPDLAIFTDYMAAIFARKGALLDITDTLPPEYTNDLVPAAKLIVTMNNKLIGVIPAVGIQGWLVNKDHLNAIGMEPPMSIENAWTWDKLSLIHI